MNNGSKAEPEKETCNREEVLRWDQKRIVHEKASQEVQQKQGLLVVDSAKLFVTGQNTPVPDAVLSFTA